MSKAPQTESEERAACRAELGYLTMQVWEITGRYPRVITERMERDGALYLSALEAADLAQLCAEIRDEFPALDLGAP